MVNQAGINVLDDDCPREFGDPGRFYKHDRFFAGQSLGLAYQIRTKNL